MFVCVVRGACRVSNVFCQCYMCVTCIAFCVLCVCLCCVPYVLLV